ncbi:Thymidylate kinase [Streptomyces tendae]
MTRAHGGAAFVLMLLGALLLPLAALVLANVPGSRVPLRHDLRDALVGGDARCRRPPRPVSASLCRASMAPASSTEAEVARCRRICGKGHEVVFTRQPGVTPVGKRLRSILLDVSSARLSDRAEAPLYAADRAEHVDFVAGPPWSAAPWSSPTATSTPRLPTRSLDATCRRPRSPASAAGPPTGSYRT